MFWLFLLVCKRYIIFNILAGEEDTPIGAMPGCYRLGWRHGLVEEVNILFDFFLLFYEAFNVYEKIPLTRCKWILLVSRFPFLPRRKLSICNVNFTSLSVLPQSA